METVTKKNSLRKNDDYKRCYRYGNSYISRYLVLYVISNDQEYNRIGISVSKKIGNSVIRHRIKRLVKESVRLHFSELKQGRDLVFVGRKAANGASYFQIEETVMYLLKKADCCVKVQEKKS